MATVLRAHVKQGRLILDEPTNLPEGTEIELVVVPRGGLQTGGAHPSGVGEAPAEGAESARFLAPEEPSTEPAPPSQSDATDAIIEQVQRQARG
ncbi:MAG: hypothetical protein MUF34_22810 [Polyangiaceae bacterium]|jgi:hypothetical protein|nr:hypothetical protein [Polyangiaceae bacterium]